MSNMKFKITSPMRFFGFFGLFIVFLFLAVKSCTDQKSKTEFVNLEKIEDLSNDSEPEKNSKEMAEFIKDVKKDISKKEEAHDGLSDKDVEVLEDKNIDRKTVKEITGKAVKIKKELSKIVKTAAPKLRKEESNKFTKSTVFVKDVAGKIDSFSKRQLQKDVKRINKFGKGKVMIYGNYFPGEVKSSGFVRAAKIRNELIRMGLKPSISAFVLPEARKQKDFFGKVSFQ